MKYRESGMPEEEYWDTFFDPVNVLTSMEVGGDIDVFIDVGCGYGTFLIPASKMISGTTIGIDIEEKMLSVCGEKIDRLRIKNIDLLNIDISNPDDIKPLLKYHGRIDYIALFNILHCEEPMKLLKSAYDLINPGGRLGIIHWIYGDTPRGPSMDIRPEPSKIIEWSVRCGFKLLKQVELPPYHYGLVFVK